MTLARVALWHAVIACGGFLYKGKGYLPIMQLRRQTIEYIKCDNCRKKIKTEGIEILMRELPELYQGRESYLHYFICPVCKHEYPVAYYTADMVKKIHDQNMLKKEIAILHNRASKLRGEAKLKIAKKADKKYSKWSKEFSLLLKEQEKLKEYFEQGGERENV